ncbi:alpha/beta fold hydrolase [Yunchengibacter salinarum]|uniref:alpha/beta fold hydrolase n=1 Tax=Yunchengibacter salinarum TaxID=3133399 RepID=UPI0035B60E34
MASAAQNIAADRAATMDGNKAAAPDGPTPEGPWAAKTLSPPTDGATAHRSFVWLHGWGQDHNSFNRLTRLLADTGHHQIFDQPGFGATPKLADGAGTADYADALARELDRRGAAGGPRGPHILVGHSFGGRVALQLAQRHPKKVKAVIIIAGAGLPRRRSLRFRLRAMALKMLGRLAALADSLARNAQDTGYRARFQARFGSADYRNAGALRATFVAVVNENLTNVARAVRQPALLLYGSEDSETPPELGARLEGLMPLSRFSELAGFGHLDILDRGAYQVEARIRRFLNDLDPDNRQTRHHGPQTRGGQGSRGSTGSGSNGDNGATAPPDRDPGDREFRTP